MILQVIKPKSTGNSNIKINLHVTFWDEFLSSQVSKPYDISREDLLADRTSLVHVYLMFVVYRTKGLRYNLFYVCVCVCVCVRVRVCLRMYYLLYCNAYLFRIIFVGSNHLIN